MSREGASETACGRSEVALLASSGRPGSLAAERAPAPRTARRHLLSGRGGGADGAAGVLCSAGELGGGPPSSRGRRREAGRQQGGAKAREAEGEVKKVGALWRLQGQHYCRAIRARAALSSVHCV